MLRYFICGKPSKRTRVESLSHRLCRPRFSGSPIRRAWCEVRDAALSGCGPSGQQRPSGAPRKSEEQDGCPGEDSEGTDGDGGSERLRCSGTRGDEGCCSGARLGGCSRWADRQRRGRGTGAEKQQRERERITQSERAEEDEQRDPADEPATEDERPRLRCASQRSRARAQPAAEPEAQGAPGSCEAWQGHNHGSGCDPGGRYDCERSTRSDPGSWEGNCDGGERRRTPQEGAGAGLLQSDHEHRGRAALPAQLDLRLAEGAPSQAACGAMPSSGWP